MENIEQTYIDHINAEIVKAEAIIARCRKVLGALDPEPEAKPVSHTHVASNGEVTTTKTYDVHEIREWAEANGIKVNDRGRLSADVIARYEAR